MINKKIMNFGIEISTVDFELLLAYQASSNILGWQIIHGSNLVDSNNQLYGDEICFRQITSGGLVGNISKLSDYNFKLHDSSPATSFEENVPPVPPPLSQSPNFVPITYNQFFRHTKQDEDTENVDFYFLSFNDYSYSTFTNYEKIFITTEEFSMTGSLASYLVGGKPFTNHYSILCFSIIDEPSDIILYTPGMSATPTYLLAPPCPPIWKPGWNWQSAFLSSGAG